MKSQVNIGNLKNHKEYINFVGLVRSYLNTLDYTEVSLPTLSPALIPESSIEVFKTRFAYEGERQNLYLTPSPELFIKRLLVEGLGDCYYLGKSYRNYELQGSLHSIEFDMLEFYQVGADYMGLAETLLKMLRYLASKTLGREYLEIGDKKIHLARWEKITVAEAFEKFAEIKSIDLFDSERFLARAGSLGYVVKGFDYEEVFSQIYTDKVEPNLGLNGFPTLLYDFPKEFASLAKMNKDGKTAQRFEFYINGVELGNCFSELGDYKEQKVRFGEEQALRKSKKMVRYPQDKEFLKSLKLGLPKCSGIAIGVERLAMVFLGVERIEDLRLVNLI